MRFFIVAFNETILKHISYSIYHPQVPGIMFNMGFWDCRCFNDEVSVLFYFLLTSERQCQNIEDHCNNCQKRSQVMSCEKISAVSNKQHTCYYDN